MSIHDTLTELQRCIPLRMYIRELTTQGHLLCFNLVIDAVKAEEEFEMVDARMRHLHQRRVYFSKEHPLQHTHEIILPFRDTDKPFIEEMKKSIQEKHAFWFN